MKILLVSATDFETAPFVQQLKDTTASEVPEFHFLTAGVGLISSTYLIMREIQKNKPDLIVQAGIAGSFSESLPPGSITLIGKDIAADVCVKEPDGYRNMQALGLTDPSGFSGTGWLPNPDIGRWASLGIPVSTGVSVNEISTSPERIEWFKSAYQAETESMEGAALHYVALMEKIPFLQLRSISNRIGERNKQYWKMKEAISVLNETLFTITQQIDKLWS